METRDDETAEEAPPAWVLRTPIRRREVWTYPVLAVALAAAVVVLVMAVGDVLARVVGVTTAVVVTAGAVALLLAGRSAYDEQSREASWRLHVVRVVVGVTVAGVVTVASLLSGASFSAALGFLVGVPQAFHFARSVPRIDRLVLACTSGAVSVVSAVLVVARLVADGVLRYRSGGWVGGAAVIVVLASVVSVVQFRAAARAPRR